LFFSKINSGARIFSVRVAGISGLSPRVVEVREFLRDSPDILRVGENADRLLRAALFLFRAKKRRGARLLFLVEFASKFRGQVLGLVDGSGDFFGDFAKPQKIRAQTKLQILVLVVVRFRAPPQTDSDGFHNFRRKSPLAEQKPKLFAEFFLFKTERDAGSL
jgi:hypothetical protein